MTNGEGNSKLEIRNSKQIRNSKFEVCMKGMRLKACGSQAKGFPCASYSAVGGGTPSGFGSSWPATQGSFPPCGTTLGWGTLSLRDRNRLNTSEASDLGTSHWDFIRHSFPPCGIIRHFRSR